MLRFGFELEGFYKNEDGQITLPPKEYTTDDFPGLVEVRNTGGGDLEEQLYLLLAKKDKYPSVDFTQWEHKFSPRERAAIRARHYEKGGVSINNIYGKSPRDIGSRTLASFQINISKYLGSIDGTKRHGLIDFVEITRELDNEFKEDIKASGRQAGFYSIKEDIRFEYRSLPNAVILNNPQDLIKRIRKCL
jgi:hypothetical protein